MGQAAANEPTMEEILASIRQIIAEEGNDESSHGEIADSSTAESAVSSEGAFQEEPRGQIEVGNHTPSETVSVGHDQMRPDSFQGSDPLAHNPLADNPLAHNPLAHNPLEGKTFEGVDFDESLVERRTMAGPGKKDLEPQRADDYQFPDFTPPADIGSSASSMHGSAQISPQNSGQTTRRALDAPLGAQNGAAQDEEARFRGALMSPGTNQAVHESFERLKANFENELDDKTEKLLKPMLSEWLDENLPTLVERLVREEIERVARGE